MTASKCISEFNLISASTCISEFHLILASKCISKPARSRPPSASLSSSLSRPRSSSPYLLDHRLRVHLRVPPDLGLHVHLHTRSIAASKCVSQCTRSRPPSASPNSLDDGLQVHLYVHTITASRYICEFTRSSSSGAPRISPKHGLQPVHIFRV